MSNQIALNLSVVKLYCTSREKVLTDSSVPSQTSKCEDRTKTLLPISGLKYLATGEICSTKMPTEIQNEEDT